MDKAHTFVLEASVSGGQWWLTPPQGPRCRYGSLSRALLCIEFAAVAARFEDPDSCIVHGALLHREGQGLALVGPCRSGKSTLAQALWQKGWDLLADDSLELGNGPDQGAWPLTRRTSLRRGSYRWLEADLLARIQASPSCQRTRKGLVFHSRDISSSSYPAGPVSLGSLVLLTGRKCDQSLRSLSEIETLRGVLPHSSPGCRGLGQGLKWLSAWAGYWNGFSLGRFKLEEMVWAIRNGLNIPREWS